MASSRTHYSVALVGAGLTATGLLAAGLARPGHALLYLTVGSLGGYLPDVDADNSRPLKATFHWGAVALGLLVLLHWAPRLSVVELAVLWLAVYLSVRVVLVRVFEKLTVHRGLFHSIPMALLYGAATVALCHRGFACGSLVSWWAGTFAVLGYASHLIVDELDGLNLFGVGTRKSLGSACTLWSPANPRASALLYLFAGILLIAAPSPTEFTQVITATRTGEALTEALLPPGRWFDAWR